MLTRAGGYGLQAAGKTDSESAQHTHPKAHLPSPSGLRRAMSSRRGGRGEGLHFVVWFLIGLCTQSFPLLGAEAAKPNVLVILVDDLGCGDLSSYGAADLRTPHIDAIVNGGMKFQNFYANSSVCSPTRAALLTGRYPDLVGVPGVIRTHADDNWGYLNPSAVLLPKLLAAGGYRCGLVGKWHLGLESPNTPNERGFEFFHGFLGDMMDDYLNYRRHGINYMRLNDREIDPKGHATELFTDWTNEFLLQQKPSQPFFLYLAYNAPHSPIQPPEEWLQRVKQRQLGIDEKRAKLVALIEHLDDGIGRVMATLKKTGLDERTLVVFTSDNGGPLGAASTNGPHRDGKGSMYEGGLKVPAAFTWPGKIRPGSVTSQRAMTMDLFPTVLEATGLKSSESIDGASFLPTLLGKPQPELRTDWFFVRREGGMNFGGKTSEAVIRGDWKLLQNTPFSPLELYDLKRDPLEREDVIKVHPRVAEELDAALRKQVQRGGSVPWQRVQNK